MNNGKKKISHDAALVFSLLCAREDREQAQITVWSFSIPKCANPRIGLNILSNNWKTILILQA
jgi:hypothetical protein